MPKKNSIYIFSFLLFSFFSDAQNCDLEFLEKEIINNIDSGAFEEGEIILEQWRTCPQSTLEVYKEKIYQSQLYRNQRRYRHARHSACSADTLWLSLKNIEGLDLPNHFLIMAEASTMAKKHEKAREYLSRYEEQYSTKNRLPSDHAYFTFIQAFLAQHGEKQYEKAQQLYRETLNLLTELPQPPVYHTGQVLRFLGTTHRIIGDFEQALYYYERELERYEAAYLASHKEIANTHYNLGAILYELLRYDEALLHFLKTHEVWKDFREPDDKFMRYLNEAIGDMYWELGNRDKTLKFYDLSMAGEKPTNNDQAYFMLSQGDTLLALGEHLTAMQYFQKALDWRVDMYGKQHAMTGACQNFIGKKLFEAGRLEEAVFAYQQTIRMLVPDMKDTALLANPSTDLTPVSEHDLLEALASKGIALVERQQVSSPNEDLSIAFETLQQAVYWMEQIRQRPISAATKAFWSGKHQRVFEALIRTALRLYERNKDEKLLEIAFEASEKSKAFLLLSALQSQKVSSFSGVPDSVVHREQSLQKAILDYEGKISLETQRCGDARERQLELWQYKLLSLKSEYDALLKTIELEFPSYHTLKYDIKSASAEKVREELLAKGRSALVAFFEGRETTFVFLITVDGLQVFDVQKDENYEEALRRFVKNISSPDHFLKAPVKSFQEFTKGAHYLYRSLLEKPLARCPEQMEHLYIIPDGSLYSLPFECLLTEATKTEKRNYGQLPYLLSSWSVSYSQSATLLCLAPPKQKPKKSYASFAPDYQLALYENQLTPIHALFTNQKEAIDGASLFNGRSFTGLSATESAFKKQAPASAILHLPLHTLLDHQDPMLSRLLFSPGDGEDGILHGFELYNQQLAADLAILSACQSGTGTFHRGEGMMSLERGFQYAGCSSLLTTLWTVDDAASAALSFSFLQKIKEGLTKDRAITKAQLEYLAEADPAESHPFYWAGFRVVGDVGVVESMGFSYWWVLLAAIFLSGMWWFFAWK